VERVKERGGFGAVTARQVGLIVREVAGSPSSPPRTASALDLLTKVIERALAINTPDVKQEVEKLEGFELIELTNDLDDAHQRLGTLL
jgi:hypothetical protein